LIQPYGWFATYQALAAGDVLKLEAINKLPLWTVMAHLSYKSAENTYLRNLQNTNQ
jgi:hypothetical protein